MQESKLNYILATGEAVILKEAEDHKSRILDANYKAVGIHRLMPR